MGAADIFVSTKSGADLFWHIHRRGATVGESGFAALLSSSPAEGRE
jgi:hypothetical protein